MGTETEKIKVLFVTASIAPAPGGTGVIMRNLIEALPKSEVVGVITRDVEPLKGISKTNNGVPIYKINKEENLLNGRGKYYLNRVFYRKNLKKITSIIQDLKPTHVIGVFPTADFLLLAFKASKKLNIPFIPYLHDTIEEGLEDRRYASLGKKLEQTIFTSCKTIFVMSDGMRDLYRRKYQFETIPLRHSFPEDIGSIVNKASNRNLFWGGGIYRINNNAVKRASEACNKLNNSFTVASSQSVDNLKKRGIYGAHINKVYLERKEYISSIETHGILLIALDFPDESPVHKDELGTIFPTKVIEYLNSGRPILVHAPKDYFISKFFMENKCGLVVQERDIESLAKAIESLNQNEEIVYELVRNAYKAVKLFTLDSVLKVYSETLKAR